MYLRGFVFYFVATWCLAQNEVNNKLFPENFLFGTGSASYQVEGGWEEDGKGENIWDRYTHNRSDLIADGRTGDIACDSYYKYKEDVAMLKDLGVDFYRFSLSWARILPTGAVYQINLAGVTYYRNLIRELKNNGIEPVVTLYYYDLPQALQDIGGWSSEFIVDSFAEYAKLCFELFGDDVKFWLTINNPSEVCLKGYGEGGSAPGLSVRGVGEYTCAHHVIKAHARAWRIYDQEFRSSQNGQVSIAIHSHWYEPETNNPEDLDAAERRLQFDFGWFAHPIYQRDYPSTMKIRIANRSALEGFSSSRLPAFTDTELDFISGTYDFMALNMYTTYMVAARAETVIGSPRHSFDVGVREYQPLDWEVASVYWLKVTPWAIRNFLNWLKDAYDNPTILITENGVPDDGSTLDDLQRISFYRDHLSNVRSAMEDGVNVIGYTAWSLMDNFEWGFGYTQKFGLYSVDFYGSNRTRTPKNSFFYYKQVVETHCLVQSCEG